MKNQLLILTVFTSLTVFATNDTSLNWNRVATAFHGTTNIVKGISADNNGNVYYSGFGQEVNPGKRHALIFGKMNDTLGYVWKTHFFGFPKNSGFHQTLANDSCLYVIGEFTGTLEIPNDTIKSGSTVNADFFFICLNTKNGEVRWARNLGYKDKPTLQFDGNKDLVLAFSTLKGEQIYDGKILDTVYNPSNTVRGYGYLTLNNMDGTVKNHCFGEYDLIGSPSQNQLVGRTVKSFFPSPFTQTYTIKTLDLNTNKISTSTESITLKGQYFQVRTTLYHPKEKSWTIFAAHSNTNGSIVFGTDTVKTPVISKLSNFVSAVRLDSTLKLVKYISFSAALGGLSYQMANDTTLLFTFGAIGNGYIGRDGITIDTIEYRGSNTNQGYYFAKCNLDFKNFTFNQFTGSTGNQGLTTVGADLDNKGNVYGAALSLYDITALPVVVKAARKSWPHLSIIAKFGTDTITTQPVSLTKIKLNNKVAIYPNPVSNILNIDTKETILTVSIYDLTGKLLAIKKGTTIDVSGLLSGVYVITIKTSKYLHSAKFVKQ